MLELLLLLYINAITVNVYSDGKAAYNASLERTKYTKELFKYQRKHEEKKKKKRNQEHLVSKEEKKVKKILRGKFCVCLFLFKKKKSKLFYREEKKTKWTR